MSFKHVHLKALTKEEKQSLHVIIVNNKQLMRSVWASEDTVIIVHWIVSQCKQQ